MNVVTGTGAGVLTIATGTTSAHHPPRLSRTTREPSDVYREGLKRCAQVPSVCRATSPRPSSGLTFARRRHSQSLDSPYLSRPRMKRRGAVSYDKNDAAAEYIRYLGDTLNQQRHVQTCTPLAELPANKLVSLSVPSRRHSRRGSIQNHTSQQCYKDLLKGSILQRVGAEEQARLIQELLRKADHWDFDIFAFRRVTGGRPLFHMGLHLLQQHHLISYWNLDIMKVMKFLALVESAYHPDNCYHNCTHAADVAQALHCLLMEPKLNSNITPLELLAIMIAALCHDLDHPGVNQSFLLSTSSYLASIHGQTSILEQHHCRATKAILREVGLLDHLPDQEREEIISLMEELILSTDFTRHKTFMATFEGMLVSDHSIDLSEPSVRKFVLKIAIKAADVSNPTRPLEISRTWSEHIMEEFFRQGDCERTMNLPISYMCDRYTISLPESQSGKQANRFSFVVFFFE
ncbi:High affinity cAMP-specific 3',5'-cyclic phosphodiesterase 7A [Geodia barretti]|uniref:Phosphodiesterase n=1 Tax=Geodia barretti TaxID=519541 RepID=A0AA35WIK4_GEOBA|nr:High affinity cAMP-specific 3',5'-cyclic phosphodiesterase 7A [Geodia barretti]